jgi:hypothetical protein
MVFRAQWEVNIGAKSSWHMRGSCATRLLGSSEMRQSDPISLRSNEMWIQLGSLKGVASAAHVRTKLHNLSLSQACVYWCTQPDAPAGRGVVEGRRNVGSDCWLVGGQEESSSASRAAPRGCWTTVSLGLTVNRRPIGVLVYYLYDLQKQKISCIDLARRRVFQDERTGFD